MNKSNIILLIVIISISIATIVYIGIPDKILYYSYKSSIKSIIETQQTSDIKIKIDDVKFTDQKVKIDYTVTTLKEAYLSNNDNLSYFVDKGTVFVYLGIEPKSPLSNLVDRIVSPSWTFNRVEKGSSFSDSIEIDLTYRDNLLGFQHANNTPEIDEINKIELAIGILANIPKENSLEEIVIVDQNPSAQEFAKSKSPKFKP